jgi:histidinol-phosphate aminotransferase
MDIKKFALPHLLDIKPYVPGKPIEEVQRELGIADVVKLASNENLFGASPKVIEAIKQAAESINFYPDGDCYYLRNEIAEKFGVKPINVAVGSGVDELLRFLCVSVLGPGDEVVFADPSFVMYKISSMVAGATLAAVPLKDSYMHDIPAMLARVTDRTKLLFVCNPNNPTGTVVHTGELAAFLDRVPADTLVVLDEAYAEYVRDPRVPDGMALYRDHPNVAVLRTFSKAYGLAGLRVGFLVAHQPVAAAVRKTMLPFTVNALAQAAAIASLAAEAELLERVDAVVKERSRVRDELLAQGWPVPPTEANFVWLRLGRGTQDFAAACARAGVAVRPFGVEGARISVGDHDANDAFLAVAHAYSRRH